MSEFIFTVLLDIPAEHDQRFNLVYDTDHLLNMVQIPGIQNCTRYKLEWSDNSDMLNYLALYQIDNPELPWSDAWKKNAALGAWPNEIRHLVTARRNGTFQRIVHLDRAGVASKPSSDSDVIYYLLQSVPSEREQRFNELYAGDHIPLMLQAPGVRSCTRYRLLRSESGDVPDYLAIYAIDSIERPRSPEWKRQTNLGAWPTDMRPHFTARRNGVYSRTGVFKTN